MKQQPITDMTISSVSLRSTLFGSSSDHLTPRQRRERELGFLLPHSADWETSRQQAAAPGLEAPLSQLSIEEAQPGSASSSQGAPPRKRQRLAGSASWEPAPFPPVQEDTG
jgi:hypothetical protein